MTDQSIGRGKFAGLLLLLQGLLLILFVVFVGYSEELLPDGENETETDSKYSVFGGLHLMLFAGFGLLLTFLRKYGFSAMGYNFLISALVIEWSTIMQGFFEMRNNTISIGLESMIKGDLAAVAVTVSFGALLGKTSHHQLLVISFIEVVIYSVNRAIATKFLHAVDAGGSFFVHAFGAYFGLGVSRVLYTQRAVAHDKEISRYTSDLFATLGTIILWVCWPSFNAVLVEGVASHRAIVNTYYALVTSCVTSCAFSSLMTKESKLSMVHLQNASLAGGVAMGTIAPMIIHPWGAVLIGFVSGAISTTGFTYIQPWLIKRLRVHDTCGVNSLHGIPGILGAIAGAISASIANYTNYKTSLYTIFPARAPVLNSTQYFELVKFNPQASDGLKWTADKQAVFQLAALVITLALAIFGGLLTGIIVKQPFFDPLKEEALYDDGEFWEVPSDFRGLSDEVRPRTRSEVPREQNELLVRREENEVEEQDGQADGQV
ncbi:unnamed protein product [Porites evermanni]|uniref:Ammonium transporter AmtB-like domain-containing protein n=1 Tax=Porites evermanni TaxID=104178 RepID=A0ABN8RC48_9CNID|nr:unnamed protein product [Porites evermanni]